MIFFGGLGAIVGGVAAIIQSSTSDDDRVFSPGIAHDARLLEERLRRSEEDPQWGQSFALRTVRECVPELRVLLKNGREYNGWLIASGEGAIVFLVSEESLEENGESEELRSTPFAEIVAIEGQVFATADDPFNGEWRPEENPKSLLQSYVFSNISVAASEAAESTP